LGIGYGTESVRWTYRFPGLPDFTFMPDPKTITRERLLTVLSRGVHNSFAQGMLRMGLPGVLLLVAAFGAAFPAGNLSRPARSHASILFIIIFTACFVDPGLESPVQLIGIGFVHGYLLALRAYATGSRRVPCLRYGDGGTQRFAAIRGDNATIVGASASTP
jgi:O-antigen ligase